jgi:TolB-like protein/Tfp pilus assembly protein PilF
MASLISGFEYDIFISYRHNDNRSGWVTEFVSALQEELGATIKDSLTIYFDKNPHDGLLETHDVDKSLEGKLKCLIFIPIISQTYSDPKSFAWQHEFCAFNEVAKSDQFGRDIKLSSGNVASRILPIRIHDLDADDQSAIEKEIEGVLRAIEFIYNEPGVNRPLKPNDNRNDSQNKIDYRNQINKVANAVKDIIAALKSERGVSRPAMQNTKSAAPRVNRKKAIVIVLLLAIVVTSYFLYPRISNRSEKSVAVLAFVDMSPGKDQEWFSDGLSEEVLNKLVKLRELKVTARTSSFFYKGKDVPLQEIAKQLGVANIVEGSVRKNGEQLRITAQLIRAEDGFHIWSDTYDRAAEDVFNVQSEIAGSIARSLLNELSSEKQLKLTDSRSQNIEAYEYYMRGYKVHYDRYYISMAAKDFEEAERYFRKSISLDPGYAEAYGAFADLCDTRSLIPEGRKKFWHTRDSLIRIGLSIDPNSTQTNCVRGWSLLKRDQPDRDSAFYYFKKTYLLNPNTDYVLAGIAGFYGVLGWNEAAQKYYIRALELDPLHVLILNQLGTINMNLGMYEEAKKQFHKAIELDHADAHAYYGLSLMASVEGDIGTLANHLETLTSIGANADAIKTLVALKHAMRGNRREGLQLAPNSLTVLAVLKLKQEFLSKLDSTSDLTSNRLCPAALRQSPLYEFVRDDPKFQAIVKKAQISYDKLAATYPTPD